MTRCKSVSYLIILYVWFCVMKSHDFPKKNNRHASYTTYIINKNEKRRKLEAVYKKRRELRDPPKKKKKNVMLGEIKLDCPNRSNSLDTMVVPPQNRVHRQSRATVSQSGGQIAQRRRATPVKCVISDLSIWIKRMCQRCFPSLFKIGNCHQVCVSRPRLNREREK